MAKKAVLLSIIIFMLTGCASTSPNEQELVELDMSAAMSEQIISLTDVTFEIVPEQTYYILMEEKLTDDGTVLRRRYVKYDGFEDTISEIDTDIELPSAFEQVAEAREWVLSEDSARLSLYPKTYLNQSVLSQWEMDEYDYVVEAKTLVPLESLRRMGAVSRLSDPLLIELDSSELLAIIESIEEDFLPSHANLDVTREVDAHSESFYFRTTARVNIEPGPSPMVAALHLELEYRVDELGHPLELSLEASFENDVQGIQGRLLPVINDLANFGWMMRDGLVEELRLYGVKEHNPNLKFANVSLHYEGEETNTLYKETLTLR